MRLVSNAGLGAGSALAYVNSREQTAALVARAAHAGSRSAASASPSTTAASPAADRSRGRGRLPRRASSACVVSTSAFGEGVNLPDVRHVVLYHLPFDEVEFNQMSGRAGRDGDAAPDPPRRTAASDARINERILACDAPSRDDLVTLYRVLVQRDRPARSAGDAGFAPPTPSYSARCLHRNRQGCGLDEQGRFPRGIAIFRDLGFRDGRTDMARSVGIRMAESPERMELDAAQSTTLRACRSGAEFRELPRHGCSQSTASEELIGRINRPIVPGFGTMAREGGE